MHDFVLRADPLPRTTTRKIRRFELRDQLEALREREGNRRESKAFVLSEADQALMDSPAGRGTVAAVKQHVRDIELIHPQMNFEIDLAGC